MPKSKRTSDSTKEVNGFTTSFYEQIAYQSGYEVGKKEGLKVDEEFILEVMMDCLNKKLGDSETATISNSDYAKAIVAAVNGKTKNERIKNAKNNRSQ